MSNYTIELRYICEHNIGLKESLGENNVNSIIEQAWPTIFENFNIFDEAYRETLCKKIIAHFYTQEISYETVGLWKFKLNTKMNEIMPYYNQLYKSALLDFNPLYDTDYWTEHSGNFSGNRNDSANNSRSEKSKTTNDASTTVSQNVNENGDSLNKHLDTPQDDVDLLLEGKYLTDAQVNDYQSNQNTTGNTKYDNTDDYSSTVTDNNQFGQQIRNFDEYAEHVAGKRGSQSFSKLIQEFRETFLNIDMMVIKELESLFMQIW